MYRLATRAHSLVGALSTRAIPLSSSIRAFSSAATPSDASAASQTNDKPANGEDDQNSVDPDKLEAYLRSKAAYQAQQGKSMSCFDLYLLAMCASDEYPGSISNTFATSEPNLNHSIL